MDVTKLETELKDVRTETISPEAVDFETALTATGYGWYHFLLLLTAVPMVLSPMFASSLMGFVSPSAECDLDLTLFDKGVLNAVSFAGMILGGVFWAHLSDTRGRRKIMIIGYFLDVVFVLGEALSQNVIQLEICRFIEGFIVCGPYSCGMTYLIEMHSKQYRPRVMIAVGIIMQLSYIILPFIAITTIQHHYNISFIGLRILPWQVFIAVSAIPSMISGICIFFFHESPKFLMTMGQNEKALKVFQNMYNLNHKNRKTDYPILQLVDETKIDPEQISKSNISKTLEVFRKPLLSKTFMVCCNNFCILTSLNCFRLWLPQLFVSLSEYETSFPEQPVSMCPVVEYTVNKSETLISTLNDNLEKTCGAEMNIAAYSNNIYVGLTGLAGYIVAGLFVTYLGHKILMFITLTLGIVFTITLCFANSSLIILIFCCLLVSVLSIYTTSNIDIAGVCFPTSLRTVIIGLNAVAGRIGSVLGTLMFPILMEVHCLSPFMMMGTLYAISCICTFFLPNSKKVSLK